MDKIIGINGIDGTQLEMVFDDEEGETTVIEIKDWDSGDVIATVEYAGTLEDFKRAVAQL